MISVKLKWLSAFFILGIVFCLCNQSTIFLSTFEGGDFAANSLLVLKAKKLSLLIGNYSRVGFNHPGPAIIYVLAFGEFIFYDLFKVVSHPISGQLIIACFYNAFWLILSLWIINKITKNILDALIMTSTVVLFLSFMDHNVFTGIWFPHLYVLPFLTLVVSLISISDGKVYALPITALSSGILVNGHISFIPIVGILLIGTLSYNYIIKSSTEDKIFSKFFLEKNKKLILLSFLISTLFFIPFIILTVKNYPGHLQEYYQYSKNKPHHTFIEAFKFLSFYWKGLTFCILGIICSIRFACLKNEWSKFYFLIFLSTLVVLLYGKYGVDVLEYTYVALFYLVSPGLFIGVSIVFLLRYFVKNKFFSAISYLYVVILFAFSLNNIRQPLDYASHFSETTTPLVYSKLLAIKKANRLVLNLKSDSGGTIWFRTLSFQLLSFRDNNNIFCIEEGWHISFTKDTLCSESEKHDLDNKYNVRISKEGHMIPINGFEAGGLTFEKYEKTGSLEDILFLQGWSSIETDFCWSTSQISSILIKSEDKSNRKISIDLEGFLPNQAYVQKVKVFVNNKFIRDVEFNYLNNRKYVDIDLLNGTEEFKVDFHFESPISPFRAGISDDPRLLGVAIRGYKIY